MERWRYASCLLGLVPIVFFDPSVSVDVVGYEAEVWRREIVPVTCPPTDPPPCFGTSEPMVEGWMISDNTLFAAPLPPGAVYLFRIRAFDAAGNRSVWATEVR